MRIDITTYHHWRPVGHEVRAKHATLLHEKRSRGHIDNPTINQVICKVCDTHCDLDSANPLARTNEILLFIAHCY